jgi:hypothetical protein
MLFCRPRFICVHDFKYSFQFFSDEDKKKFNDDEENIKKAKNQPVDKNDNYYVVLRYTTYVVFVSSSINCTTSKYRSYAPSFTYII